MSGIELSTTSPIVSRKIGAAPEQDSEALRGLVR
jgi:hypothetical protein